MEKILLVEDDPFLLDVMNSILATEGYEVYPASQGRLALDLFVMTNPNLIISDIMMPNMDGFELLRTIRSMPQGITVPFLFLSARTERADVIHARELGVDDYLFKPFDSVELVQAVRNRLDRRRVVELFDARAAHLQTVSMLANVIETRDPYTAGHVERVSRLSENLAMALNWTEEDIAILEIGANMHDVGKITVPKSLLKKTGPLTEKEWGVMRLHPQAGAKMLEGIDHLRAAIPYVLCHHEWWNGSGYPNGLAGLNIPIEGRILAITDAFDAMTTNRPYHSSMTDEEALAEVERMSGVYFDPDIARVFIQSYKT